MRPEYIAMPEQLISMNRYVTLADVMFVSGFAILGYAVPMGETCNGAVCATEDCWRIGKCLKMVIGLYRRAGFIC